MNADGRGGEGTERPEKHKDTKGTKEKPGKPRVGAEGRRLGSVRRLQACAAGTVPNPDYS